MDPLNVSINGNSAVQHMFETSLAASPELVGQQYAFVAFDLAIMIVETKIFSGLAASVQFLKM